MKLYRAYNGYTGSHPLSVLVLAESKERAEEIAAAEYQETAKNPYYDMYSDDPEYHKEYRYDESFWNSVTAVCLSQDAAVEWVGVVED